MAQRTTRRSSTPPAAAPADAPVVDPDRVQHLDPRRLLLDANVRHQTSADADLVASLRQHGVLQPITAVLTADGAVRVRYGHRRTLAAIEADLPTVPVQIVADEATTDADQIDRILRQLAENDDRAGLVTTDRVVAVQQLAAFGLEAGEIARRTRRPRAQVQAALTVAESQTAQAVVARFAFVDLVQAAAIAEFEDDPETVKVLVAAAKTGQFEHAAQRARDDRAEAAARDAIAAPLRAAGLTVVRRDEVRTFRTLDRLRDAETWEVCTVETHATCPGHAVAIDEDWQRVTLAAGEPLQPGDDGIDDDDQNDGQGDGQGDGESEGGQGAEVGERTVWRRVLDAVYGCTDPRAYGHPWEWDTRERWAAVEQQEEAPLTDDERAAAEEARRQAASAERRDVITSNKAWRSATQVRRRWVRALLDRKTAPKAAAAFLAAAQACDPAVIAEPKGNQLAAAYLGLPKPAWGHSPDVARTITEAPSNRVVLLHLMLTLACYESYTTERAWRDHSPPPAAT